MFGLQFYLVYPYLYNSGYKGSRQQILKYKFIRLDRVLWNFKPAGCVGAHLRNGQWEAKKAAEATWDGSADI